MTYNIVIKKYQSFKSLIIKIKFCPRLPLKVKRFDRIKAIFLSMSADSEKGHFMVFVRVG